MITTYADTGCRLAPSCLTCPFDRCIYEQSRPGSALETRARNAELVRLRSDGWTATRLAVRFGLTPRHVRRVLAAQREEVRPC